MDRPPEKTREQVELDLMVELSLRHWHDVTEVCPDPAAVQCFAYGIDGKNNGTTLYFLTRYEDEGAEFALVSYAEKKDKERAVCTEQFKLQWLWEQVTKEEPDA